MLDGVLSLIPGAKVSVIGIARNEETLEAHTYLERLVGELDQRWALIVDPMLATGGSMVATIDLLKAAGCKTIRALVLVAAPRSEERRVGTDGKRRCRPGQASTERAYRLVPLTGMTNSLTRGCPFGPDPSP